MNIKDIAKLSGCSISTVSRALNDYPDVSEATKQKIKEIVKEHRYVPNSYAKNLKQSTSNDILVVVKGAKNTFFASILELIQNCISKLEYGMDLDYVKEDENEVLEAVRLINERKPVGVIFLGGNVLYFKESFNKITIPAVLVSTCASHLFMKNLSSISIDDFNAAGVAIEYAISKNHRNIAVMSGVRKFSYTSRLRYDGIKNILSYHNLNFDEKLLVEAHYTLKSAYDATNELLDRKVDISLVFAMSDIMAIGVISAITDRGLKVPEDISVIGFDGIEFANYINPKLTTIKQPIEKMAEKSIEMLLELINDIENIRHELVPFELVEGKSVKGL